MTVPGLVTVLHPNWEKSPISAPNFFRLVGRKSSFPTFIRMFFLSLRTLDNLVPAPRLTPTPNIESPT